MHAHKVLPQDSTAQLSNAAQLMLRERLEKGLPVCTHPYQEIAAEIGIDEAQVLEQIALWREEGLIKRFGVVVKHRQLGYTANAMVVWDIENSQVDKIASQLAKRKEISLCYQRPRRLPDWPYNLFCMIHGKSREVVEQQIRDISEQLELNHINKDVLFSNKAFKQNGARYRKRIAK
ncbi:siroheme decarboxylase subunit beta [Thalassotalea sp. PLHSN55]|uniref:siroheme decarboxylase subunit beta n=1 Tax=Thalassotalea sp. PLHSN55 TaxID=3435888 RepID=UPI003F861F32